MHPLVKLAEILHAAAEDEKTTVEEFIALLKQQLLPPNRDDGQEEMHIYHESLRVHSESYFDVLCRKNRKEFINAIFQNNLPLPSIILGLSKDLRTDQFWRQYWIKTHTVPYTTPLMHAMENGHDDLAVLLLSKVKHDFGYRYEDKRPGGNEDIFYAAGIAYNTPKEIFLTACQKGLTDSLNYLLNRENLAYYLGKVIKEGLEWAIQNNNLPLAWMLLTPAKILENKDHASLRRNLLRMAITQGADDIVDLFKSEGLACQYRSTDFDLGPEEIALETRNEARVKQLEPENLEHESITRAYKRLCMYRAAKMSEAFCQPYQQRVSALWQGSSPQEKADCFKLALQYQDWDKVIECIKARAVRPEKFDLFAAYDTGNINLLDALLAAKADYRLDPNGQKGSMSLFSKAMKDNKPEVVRCLVKHGVAKKFTQTDIWQLVGNMSLEMFRAFEFSDDELRSMFATGYHINENLMSAFSENRHDVFTKLKEKFPAEVERIERACREGASERLVAECKKRPPNQKVIEKLFSLGARQAWDNNQNPLTLFLENASTDNPSFRAIFPLLLSHQPNFKSDSAGVSPLKIALPKIEFKWIKALLDNGASVRSVNLTPRETTQFKKYYYSLTNKSAIARHDAVLLFLEDNVNRLEGRKYTFESTRNRNSKKILELNKYIQHLKNFDPEKGIENIFSLKLPDAESSLLQTLNKHSRTGALGKTQSLKDFLKIFGKEITGPELKTLLKVPKIRSGQQLN